MIVPKRVGKRHSPSILAAVGAQLVLFVCVYRSGAIAAVLAPKTPAIVSIAGGALAPHVDYVRLTYVLLDGSESHPSAEVPNGVSRATLTRVFSPEPRADVVGYNVYAVSNNGDTDTGHIRQNDAPVPTGTPFDEPATGWRTVGKKLDGSAPERTIEALAFDGASVAMPRTPTLGGNIVFSHASGDVVPVVTIVTNAASSNRPGSTDFSFDRSTHFTQLPAFLLYPSTAIGKEDPAIVRLTDKTTGTEIATYDKYEFGAVTFLGQMWNGSPITTPFDVRAGDVYEASFISHPSSMVKAFPLESPDFVLPEVGRVAVTMHVPPPSDGAPSLIVRDSLTPPLGVEPPNDPTISSVSMYAIVVLPTHATYDGIVHVTVRVPHNTPPGTEYSIAAFDPQWWNHGWYLHVMRGRSTHTGTVDFGFDMNDRHVYAQTYVFALCKNRPLRTPEAKVPVHIDPRPVIAVVGDSTMLMQAIPPSAFRCSVKIEASNNCQYLHDPIADYASIAGSQLGYRVLNFSHLGTATTEDVGEAEAASQSQVPQIPTDTSIVLVTAGVIDNLGDGDPSKHLDDLTVRIRQIVPRARIVYVGVRYFNDSSLDIKTKQRIDRWDDRESMLGSLYGGFLDLREVLPAGYTDATPDGAHFTQRAAERIAQALLPILRRMK